MLPYAIGFDIGISSVGWAVVGLDNNERPCGIINMGSRIFDAAEQPKTGDSLAAPRREARSARRRLRRRRHRKERIRQLLVNRNIISQEKLDTLFDGQLDDIYTLRVRALDEAVSPEEFARILLHISQRRGFRSNRKNGNSKEDGELLKMINRNQALMRENGYRTVAEMFLQDKSYAQAKRNKGGAYTATVSRDMVADEVRQVFAAQRKHGMAFASEDTENAYLEILLSQRSFDEGPGGNSPYSGSLENMWGNCTFLHDEPRAAKATYSFEYFNLLERINHIRIIDGGQSTPLTQAQRRVLIDLAHKTEKLDYAALRKQLGMTDSQTFNMVHYRKDKTVAESEKAEKFSYLTAYHKMRRAFDKLSKGYIDQMPIAHRNAIGQVLSLYRTEEKICGKLRESGLNEQEIEIAEALGSFTKSGHLCTKVCDDLIPYLEQGMNYDDACTAAGYEFRGHSGGEKTKLLHLKPEDLESVTSPVVHRAVSQTVKVLNAIIRERGCSPTYINIELAREMAQTKKKRNEETNRMNTNHANNERLLNRIRNEYGKENPTGLDLVKLKLFEEQGGVCAYSLKQMSLEKLFDSDYAEVDHIIPYSISFDDSYKNKVLVLTKENRDKGNRLPMQYLTGKRRDDFVVWVNSSVRNDRKKQHLLKECITEDDENRWKERNLQDTKTMSRFLLNYINDNLEFAPSKRKKRVTAVNGSVTSHMRKRWGITKIRENGDLHHAVDALVIACTTDGMIQNISRYNKWRECRYTPVDDGSMAVDPDTGEVLQHFPYPWPCFRKELEARLGSNPLQAVTSQRFPIYMNRDFPVRPLFVSRMPRRKVTGAAHRETIKSPVALDSGIVVVKRPLTDLKLDKNGEIANYYEPQSDRLLYEALKERLIQFDGDGKKAFEQPFRKPKGVHPKREEAEPPIVNKVKLYEPTTLNVPVHKDKGVAKGVANHSSMVRIDVFKVEGDGYYFVPIYVADTLKPELPNKACVAHKNYDEWKEMQEEDFIFSLYPSDLVKVTHKKALKLTKSQKESTLPDSYETKSELLYYVSTDIASGGISCRTHDNSYGIRGIGIKTLENLEKYTVDVLGEYHKVEKEPRQPFHRKRG